MGVVCLTLWACVAAGGKRFPRACKALMTLGVAWAMLTQELCLWLDGALSLQTGLPLHLCGFFGVLTPWLVWKTPAWLWEWVWFLGAPAAFITVLFPAVAGSSRPMLMTAAFMTLHAVLACAPLLLRRAGTPAPVDPRRAFVLSNGYLLFILIFNALFHTNYLFLQNAPVGTPLALLAARGAGAYIGYLEMLVMLLMTLLKRPFTSGNTSSCSRWCRCN